MRQIVGMVHKNSLRGRLDKSALEYWKYLIFWPVFGLMFLTVERLWLRDGYYPIHCPIDDAIPFCEYFLIPYLFWFVFLVGIHIYTFFFDAELFRKLMRFIIVSYSAAMLIYILFPSCQELRPVTFERDNIFTRFISDFYKFDTNTNVCPSIHVIGSMAVMFSAWHSKHFNTPVWRIVFGITAFLISISTVFMKQHSIIDVFAAIPVCALAYYFVYIKKKNKNKRKLV